MVTSRVMVKAEHKNDNSEQYKVAPITAFAPNPNNPRAITAQSLDRLADSLQKLPAMLMLRPIVVRSEATMQIIGGNMRFLAARKLGIKDLPYVSAETLTDEEVHRFILADNASFGTWDYSALHELVADYNYDLLSDYGIIIPADMFDCEELGNPSEKDDVADKNKNICPACGQVVNARK